MLTPSLRTRLRRRWIPQISPSKMQLAQLRVAVQWFIADYPDGLVLERCNGIDIQVANLFCAQWKANPLAIDDRRVSDLNAIFGGADLGRNYRRGHAAVRKIVRRLLHNGQIRLCAVARESRLFTREQLDRLGRNAPTPA